MISCGTRRALQGDARRLAAASCHDGSGGATDCSRVPSVYGQPLRCRWHQMQDATDICGADRQIHLASGTAWTSRTGNRRDPSPELLPQAALASPKSGNGSARVACAWFNRSLAISRHEPQLEPQPVRMVSSARLAQPFSAASRIWWSVTPLQMQTYTVSVGR